jgi:hypothetical protein
MSQWLKQSTSITLSLGPFLDKTDGVTEETGLAGTMTVKLSKNGGALGARNSATAISYDTDGNYLVELNATDTNTLGRLRLQVNAAATHLPVWQDFAVVRADIWALLFADGLAAIADKILGRNIAGASDGGRTVTSALRSLRNKVDTVSVPGVAVVYQENDATEDHRRNLTTDATALPIVTADPTT